MMTDFWASCAAYRVSAMSILVNERTVEAVPSQFEVFCKNWHNLRGPDVSQDEELFFHDYAISHKKLSELGCTAELYGSGSKSAQVDASTSTILAQAGVGVVVTAIVVVASYMYDMKRKVALK